MVLTVVVFVFAVVFLNKVLFGVFGVVGVIVNVDMVVTPYFFFPLLRARFLARLAL